MIGFSQLVDGEEQALVSIGGNLKTVRTGDTVSGVTVISLDAPNVTLQQRNERWTIALFNQPMVNGPVTFAGRNQAVSNMRQRRPVNSTFLAEPTTPYEDFSGFEATNEAFGGTDVRVDSAGRNLPPLPDQVTVGEFPRPVSLPETLDLPEPPVLPGESASINQTPPGLDDLPRLPSL